MERKITLMETESVSQLPAPKRVAAYCRVSSGKDEMLHSLSAQVSYYSKMIQSHKDWQYVGVYADEAKTGTKGNRPQFQQLLEDCKKGKIDLVLTKSISRFARNTVTMLETVRELKALDIEVYFENERISSLSGDGELMLTILSSFAQEESKSVSDNCKWRLRNKFKQGQLHSINIYGYRLENGILKIKPTEADTVRRIYADYLSGLGVQAITNKLNEAGVPTRLGGEWHISTIRKMLSCEKYIGNLLLQKTFVADHISKRKCNNNGELPMYFVENAHEPIIDKATFEAVQAEKERRAFNKGKGVVTYPFTGKITCGICGKHYRRKINNAGTKYAKPVWLCSTFNIKGKKHCASHQIPEDILLEIVPQNFKSITVPCDGEITVTLADGRVIALPWANKSRSEIWNDDMKEKARNKALERSYDK